MPALAPYIPPRQANLDAWFLNFSALITANPARYGLAVADATAIAGYVAAWTVAYTPVTSPSTRTASAVAAKDSARVSTLAQIRVYAQQVANNPGVLSSDKVALGLNPKTSTPSPIAAPTSNPIIVLQSLSNLSAILRFRDSAASVSVKAKPYGVLACQIFGMTSASAITDPTGLPLKVSGTKSPLVVTFASGDVGKQFYAAARWNVVRGAVSPWSPLINFTIVGAG